MKENKLQKRTFVRLGAIVFAFLMLLLISWLLFSFISMRSDRPYVSMFINLDSNQLAQKVRNDFPKRDEKYIEYQFPIILEEYSEINNEYTITGVPFNFDTYYQSRDESRFTIALAKNKGEFDFSRLEFNEPLVIKFVYRVEKDLKYFFDFSFCVVKKAYSNLFDINTSCGRGNCLINRDLTQWSVELTDKSLEEKVLYYDSINKDPLVRGLFNYFITDDFGYFNKDSFKLRTTQLAVPDGTYKMSTTFITDKIDSSDSSTIQLMLYTISEMINRKYIDYEEIDLMSYMQTINSYSTDDIKQSFYDCQFAYNTVNNLSECSTQLCNEIKSSSFNHCKNVLDYQLLTYDEKVKDYYGYDTLGSGNSYLLSLPSEMIYYNSLIDLLGLNGQKYTKNQIYSYFSNSEKLENAYPTVMGKCHLLKGSEDMKSEYNDLTLTSKIESIFTSLPDFSSLCNGILKDEYCSLNIAKKLICAEATLNSYPDVSKSILYDSFYNHYYLSSVAPKLNTYELYRADPIFSKNENSLEKLDEYGYFVWRVEQNWEDGIAISSFADMLDSYYFIYLIDKINEN